MESRNLLVVPLDRRREWYRYHHLFRELLSSELRRREPSLIPELHLHAAESYEANGMPEAAVTHAQAAGDADRVERLVLAARQPGVGEWAVRHGAALDGVVRANGLVERYPGIAVHGALMMALVGRPGGTERWAAAAERTSATGMLADGNTIEGTMAYLRALLCRDGIAEMRNDARLAMDGVSPSSPYRAALLHAEGVSYLLDGAPDRRMRSSPAPWTWRPVPISLPSSLCSSPNAASPRSSAMTGSRPRRSPDRALAMMNGGQYDDYWTSALVYAWVARVASQRGDPADGRELVARAARLRPLLNYALPVVSAQALLEMARAYVALADQGGARAVLRQAQDIFQQRPSLGSLPQQADELRAKVDTIRAGALGASSLTTAESRLLPLLPTHLSFREIGERLYVSRHTVKTQAISIYRKFGVSSRSETITRMHELGLLEHA